MEENLQQEVWTEDEVLPVDESGRQNYGSIADQAAKIVDKANTFIGKTLEVTDELKSYSETQPNNGYSFREEVIREAKDMSTKEKLDASRKNDEFEMAKAEKAKDMANEIRDNKTKNCCQIIMTAGFVAVISISLCIPESRKAAFEFMKYATKIH